MTKFHTPVLVSQLMSHLAVQPGQQFIDATIGGGGHAAAIINLGGHVFGIDRDPQAVSAAQQRLPPTQAKVVQANFTDLATLAVSAGISQVNGIIFDLGVSSHQLETPARGFSFNLLGPLDMRMDPALAVTAADLVNALGRKELYVLFTKLAQEKLARPIADAIVESRRLTPFTTTQQLAQLVEAVYRRHHFLSLKLHPATKVFQALRIAVNDELNNLKLALPQALSLLKPGGRLAVISFHEGEDRLVKHFFKTAAATGQGQLITRKPLIPDPAEILANPRCRSAKLRIIEKI